MAEPFDRDPTVRYGVVEEINGVRRVTCRNPSPMTFTGTRSYIIGRGRVAVIDPGPDDPSHRAALMGALGPEERVSHILITHTHVDHSGGARALATETGAPILGFGMHDAGMSEAMHELVSGGAELGGGEGADRTLTPDKLLVDGDRVEGADWALDVLHTPGHLANHLSFVGDGVIFSGDTLMGWATTLVSPPEGDMAALMRSLRRLEAHSGSVFLPGHGHPVTDAAGMIAHQIAHREGRVASILDALGDGPATAADLAARIYVDVDPALLPAAERNVLATLLWQMDEGRVAADRPLRRASSFAIT